MSFKNAIVEDKQYILFLKLRCVEDTKRSFTSENGTMTEISSNMKNSIVTSEMKMD